MGWRQLFAQWNTKTLGGSSKLGVSDYELITDGVHVEVDNLAALEAKNTVGQATNLQSQSGPIANTAQIIHFDQDTGSSYYTVFTPGIGEVWQFIGASVGGGSGLSGTLTHEIDLYDADSTDRLLLIDYGATSSSDYPIFETNTNNPILVGYPLRMRVRSEGTFTSIAYSFGFIRVR